MTTFLVTGGAGFIGSNLVRHLVTTGKNRVINVDSLTYAGNLDSLSDVAENPSYVFVQADIANQPTIRKTLATHQPNYILNLAAESHVDRSIDGPLVFVDTNIMGTAKLLVEVWRYWRQLNDKRKKKFRFLHVSTDEVYGSLGPTGKFTETTRYTPNSPYAASKAASDHLVRSFHHTYGLPILTTNCSNNYGPFQFPEKLIPLMILNAVSGQPLPVYGDGLNVRDWLHVHDHCAAIETVATSGKPGEVYNIGGDCEQTNLEVVQRICKLVDELQPDLPHVPTKKLITYVTDRPGHDKRYAVDSSKIQSELSWAPHHNFESGLRQTVQWYLENTEWVKNVLSGNYRLPRQGLSSDEFERTT